MIVSGVETAPTDLHERVYSQITIFLEEKKTGRPTYRGRVTLTRPLSYPNMCSILVNSISVNKSR